MPRAKNAINIKRTVGSYNNIYVFASDKKHARLHYAARSPFAYVYTCILCFLILFLFFFYVARQLFRSLLDLRRAYDIPVYIQGVTPRINPFPDGFGDFSNFVFHFSHFIWIELILLFLKWFIFLKVLNGSAFYFHLPRITILIIFTFQKIMKQVNSLFQIFFTKTLNWKHAKFVSQWVLWKTKTEFEYLRYLEQIPQQRVNPRLNTLYIVYIWFLPNRNR